MITASTTFSLLSVTETHWLAVNADMVKRSCIVFNSLHNVLDRGGMEKEIELVLDRLGKLVEKSSGWIFQYLDCSQQLNISLCNIIMMNMINWIVHQNISRGIPNQPDLIRTSYYRMCVDSVLPEVIPYLMSYWLVVEQWWFCRTKTYTPVLLYRYSISLTQVFHT